MEQKWATLHFGELKVETRGEQHVFEVQVYLRGLDPNSVRIGVYGNSVNGSEPMHQEMINGRQLAGANGFIYSAQVPSTRPSTDYTARVIPHYAGVAAPLEAARILWQR